MLNELPSNAEQFAVRAQNLRFAAQFNLVGTRHAVRELLAQFGRLSIFAQYSKHDISHVETLLKMLDWVIPKDTVLAMTPADWLMIVLAIYFHDAGLIVTQNEFDRRDRSGFRSFSEPILASGDSMPYSARVLAMRPDERERFLYQEFVRTHHAERIRCWIVGVDSAHLGVSEAASNIVARSLAGLSQDFRDDLGMVCESHHLEDLGDTDKYNPRRAYGSDPGERSNLQYAALLLRTVDLLHITQDRTPSVQFALTAPSDPKSIEEWHKQMPVVAVTAAPARDADGAVVPDATPDTIEVTGNFHDPLGFFALTEYLHYAGQQLRQSYSWAERTRTREALSFNFPWRKIDSSHVRALGFESRHFAFELDKPKILSLLTGHTIYSNPEVVVRELVQNSLDAVRLQTEESGATGSISLELDSSERTITIVDNGTGMTQQIIQDHFLNVGSSRYRDPSFIKEYPEFSAISRFGIGILSIFMISDEVEVTTKSESDSQARNISIRSLNGKYLIRLLPPHSDEVPREIRSHGTSVKLRVRAGLQIPAVDRVAKHWILFPGCEVSVKIDGQLPVRVGFQSPKEALIAGLGRIGIKPVEEAPHDHRPAFRVVEYTEGPVTLAMVLSWQAAYRNWVLTTPDRLSGYGRNPPEIIDLSGVCVQGIRINASSPGFDPLSFFAISNVSGSSSPATNVARSSLDPSHELDEMLRSIYRIYARYISEELNSMATDRGLSISDAASEGRYLMFPLYQQTTSASRGSARLFAVTVRDLPVLTLDEDARRSLTTINELIKAGSFWTVESSAYRSAEQFLRRVPGNVSLGALGQLTSDMIPLPAGRIVSGYFDSARLFGHFSEAFDVQTVEINSSAKQVNFGWIPAEETKLWRDLSPRDGDTRQRFDQLSRIFQDARSRPLVLMNGDVIVAGATEFVGVRGMARNYLFRGNDIHAQVFDSLERLDRGEVSVADFVLMVQGANWLLGGTVPENTHIKERIIEHWISVLRQHGAEVNFPHGLLSMAEAQDYRMFDPLLGDRDYWASGANWHV